MKGCVRSSPTGTLFWEDRLLRSWRSLSLGPLGFPRKVLFHVVLASRNESAPFVSKKTPEWIRRIIDARRANWSHQSPPATRLATPRSFMDVQYHKHGDGPLAFGVEADVTDCFYNFMNEKTASWFGVDLPMTCGRWKQLGGGGGPDFFGWNPVAFYAIWRADTLPSFRGLCMGWAWALFLGKRSSGIHRQWSNWTLPIHIWRSW